MVADIHAREYKLLLDPQQFPAILTKEGANDFWYKVLDHLYQYSSTFDFKGEFNEIEQRQIQFLDLPNCALTANNFALRVRTSDANGTLVTLKLRASDFYVVEDAFVSGNVKDADKKFEEDIAPLEIKPKERGASIVFPTNHSIHSRYAFSATHEQPQQIVTVGDVLDLYPLLETALRVKVTGSHRSPIAGPLIEETVAAGPEIKLDGRNGKFALTYWSFEDAGGERTIVAELSFKCKTPDGAMSGKDAQKAYDLFVALQANLNINVSDASKTAMVLPTQCACY